MKHILSIQDLSCLGKCSLAVALPVISAMGHSCTVLPTAVLSTHTGFPSPYVHPMTDDILPIAQHWQSVGASFDAVSVGYLSSPQQSQMVQQVLDDYKTFTVIDPVLGDNGQLYSGMTDEHVKAMRKLCTKGTVLVPNMTEAALLTGLPYRRWADQTYLDFLLAGMLDFGAEGVIITGVHWDEDSTGFVVSDRQNGCFSYEVPEIPKQIHGTGDLYTAALTGALMQGASLWDSAQLAAQFVERVVDHTPKVSPFGVSFEQQLPWLIEQTAKLPTNA